MKKNQIEYTTFDVVEKFDGINREKLRNWISKGYVKPSRISEDSRGKKSFFSAQKLFQIRLFQRLLQCAFPPKIALEVLALCKLNQSKGEKYDFCIYGQRSGSTIVKWDWLSNKDSLSMEYVKDLHAVVVVNLKKISEEVDLIIKG